MAATNVTLPRFSQRQVAKLCGRSRGWVQNHVPRPEEGTGYDPAEVHAWAMAELQATHEAKIAEIESDYQDQDLAEIAKRKKRAEAANAEALLQLNKLKIDRVRGKLMPIDWTHHWLKEAAAELRKPIEIIGRSHPEHAQLILNGLDSAADKIRQILDRDPDESVITTGQPLNGNGRI